MVKCIIVGDVMPGAKRIGEIPSALLLNDFKSADIVIGNLECPIVSQSPERINLNKIPLWSTADNLAILKQFHFTHFGINNNHAYDLFEAGLDETVAHLGKLHIHPFGINYRDTSQFFIIEQNNIRIGLFAVNCIQANFTSHLAQNLESIDTGMLRENVDFLVCSIHWGDDHNIFINRWQQETARKMIDRGVDLVIGHHPHVPQGFEIYKRKFIFYSLGNFICTPREHYDYLPYQIRYDDNRENILFQRLECKIGLFTKFSFDKHRYQLTDIKPVFRPETLPTPLPQEHYSFYDNLIQSMQEQIVSSNYLKNEKERKNILISYTLPLILKHPLYWPIFFKKVTVSKVRHFIKSFYKKFL